MTVVIAMANGTQSGRREMRDRICRGPLRASAWPGAGEAVAGTAGAAALPPVVLRRGRARVFAAAGVFAVVDAFDARVFVFVFFFVFRAAGAVSDRKTHPDGEPDVTSSGTVNEALFLVRFFVRFFATIGSAPVAWGHCTAARRGRGAAGALAGNRYP